MANLQENYNTRRATGVPLPSRILDVMDTTPGLTDALYASGVKSAFGDTAPAWVETAEIDDEPGVPTLDVVLSKLGVKAEKDPTGIKAARKFVDEFADKQGVWKKKIIKDPDWGERGWETVRDLFKQVSNDLMQYNIIDARKQAMSGETIGEKALSAISTALYPRMKRAGEEGREPTTSEIVGDLGSQVAYAVPMSKVLGGASTLGKALLANAAAPVAVAGYDLVTDEDKTPSAAGLEALLGTATNLGLNRWLAPFVGRVLATGAGKISQRLTPGVRRIFEAPPTGKEKAAETVANAQRILAAPEVASTDVLAAAASGSPIVTAADKRAAQAVVDIAEQATKGVRPAMAAVLATGKFPAEKIFDVAGGMASGSKNRLTKEGSAKLGKDLTDKILNMDKAEFSRQFREHPELLALYMDTKGPLATLGGINDVARTELFNQIGNVESEVGENILKRMGVDVSGLKENVAKTAQEKKARAAISAVLSGDTDITPEDELYLRRIQEDPDYLKFNHDDPAFKIWLLTRGHRLLQGTAAHRPLWEVR